MEFENFTEIQDLSVYQPNQRIKGLTLNRVSTPEQAVKTIEALWILARTFDAPLVQHRAIVSSDREQELQYLTFGTNSTQPGIKVIGKIPFKAPAQQFGLYYLQRESPNRAGYTFNNPDLNINHISAVEKGLLRRQTPPQALDSRFEIQALDYHYNGGIDLLTGEHAFLTQDRLVHEVIEAHKKAFEYPHDKAQRQEEGVQGILSKNPVIIAFDKEEQRVASVCLIEQDPRLTFAGITMVEPTYFTLPEFEGRGLSLHLRLATQRLVDRSQDLGLYDTRPILLFNESIRSSSFQLSLRSGCSLGGNPSSIINGNLGEAYTYIGPANPQTGLMPMGLTYYASPAIRI